MAGLRGKIESDTLWIYCLLLGVSVKFFATTRIFLSAVEKNKKLEKIVKSNFW